MSMPAWLIITCIAAYTALLFAIAWQRDRQAEQPGFKQSPLIYALALSVYCTSWTFFGAVGTAASSGWDYLPIYLGPAIVFLFLPRMIRRIGDVAERESVTSISDFLSARYGKSRKVGVLVTIAAVAGSLPYIALQLKSVGMSFQALTSNSETSTSGAGAEPVLVTAISLALFAILFGARHSDMTRNNAGLMRVLAFEAIVKLSALVAVAVLSVTLISSMTELSAPRLPDVFPVGDISARFITITLLSMAAILCLPRQFHVAIIERRSHKDNRAANWLFPIYMLITSLAVIPITLAGIGTLPAGVSPDLYVLQLPLAGGDGLLAMAVFLGGFSAATGMVIVAAVALSSMVTNELIVPALVRSGRISSVSGSSGARLLLIRRTVIVVLLLLAYGYYRAAGSSEALAQIGLLSFAAAAQLAPALIGAIYWRRAKQAGVVFGLGLGMLIWTYTLFLPALIGIETMAASLPSWLNPHALFGFSAGDSLVHGVIWSLCANTLGFTIASMRAPERLRDRIQAAAFVGDSVDKTASDTAPASYTQNVTPDGLKALASRFLASEAVEHAFSKLGIEHDVATRGSEPADWRVVQRTERLLASALGASSARVVMSSAIGGADVSLGDLLSMLDQHTQAERFDRHMLQSMLENIAQGISVVDHEQKLVAWNSAYVEMFAYPTALVRVGEPIAHLIEHNISTGWIEGDPAVEALRRTAHIRAGRPHMYERQNPDGRYLRIVGNPMPGGGYVTTFTDITDDKAREQALLDANESLEQRVKERTHDLEQMAMALDTARAEAEGADASKTRFLAAASHDLLQPLNAARLFLGAVNTDQIAGASGLIEKADRAVRSADELLKGLLDISRLDHSNVEAKPTDLPIGPILEDLVDEATPMAQEIGLDIRLVPSSLKVTADPDFLQSILRNFISNARRYTRQGVVLVGARRVGQDNVRIEVWDTGPGIPEDKQSRLFEEFERLEDADNMGIRGAGLGLSVASRMAKLMGTEVRLRSILGKGSVFSVTLPRAEGKKRQTQKAIAKQVDIDHALGGLRVLCVDDEPIILDGMQALLEKWSCDATVARTIDDATSHLKADVFDVIIADFHLKDRMTGLELILRERTRLTHSGQTVLLTAQATPQIEKEAIANGVLVLHKPVDPNSIKAFLSRCVAETKHQAAE